MQFSLKMLYKLFSVLIIARWANANLEDFAMPKYGSALTDAVSDIIFKFYMNESSAINVMSATVEEQYSEALQGTINEILYNLRSKIVVQVEEYFSIQSSKRKKRHNLIFCDTYESFLKIYEVMDLQHFDFQGFYLIIISNNTGNNYEMMVNMFERLWIKQIVNINILWMPQGNVAETMMYTYYPYSESYCGKAIPIKLNQFRFGKWLHESHFFPNKMSDLHGCPLHVATFRNPPFMIIKEHGIVEVDGIDGILLRVLAQKMNFNVELYLSELLWGDVYANGSSTGEWNKFCLCE